MRIAVTGGSGFIGQYFIRDYGSAYECVVPVRDTSKMLKKAGNITYLKSDYSFHSLMQIFSGCEAVIHLAGQKNLSTQTQCMENIQFSSNVFEACKELQIGNIINVSSRAVWGNERFSAGESINEVETPKPDNMYGLSKLCVETLADYYNRTYGMHIKSYRMGEVCGLDLKKGMTHIFWKNLLEVSVANQPIPIYGTGAGGRDLIYIKDVIRALDVGLKAKDVSGIFHIGRGAVLTNLEIAQEFCRIFLNQAGICLQTEKDDGGTKWHLDVQKAKQILDYETRYDLKSMVEDIKVEYLKFVGQEKEI